MPVGLANLASIIPYLSLQASSIGQHFQRLLSFNSTDGPDQEAPIINHTRSTSSASNQGWPPPAVEASFSPFHVQAAAAPDADAAPDRDSERIIKYVQPVALFLATVSFGLTVTQPVAVDHSRLLFDAYTTFLYLTLSMGIGLSIYSIVAPEGPTAAWVQKRLMVVGLGCMAAAFVLRTCIVLPMSALTSVWLLFLLAGLVIFLSLLLAWNYRRNHGSAVVEDARDAV